MTFQAKKRTPHSPQAVDGKFDEDRHCVSLSWSSSSSCGPSRDNIVSVRTLAKLSVRELNFLILIDELNWKK